MQFFLYVFTFQQPYYIVGFHHEKTFSIVRMNLVWLGGDVICLNKQPISDSIDKLG